MIRPLVGLAAAALLAGCLGGAKPPPFYLALTPASTLPPGTTRTAAAGDAITIIQPRVPAALSSNRIPVSTGDTAIAYVKGAQWVDEPAKLFRDLVSETVAARTGRLVLDNRQFSLDPGTTVTGELRNFGVDSDTGEAVVTYDAARASGTTVEERRFEARVPVTPIEAAPVGAALNRAANQVATEVATWIGG